MLFLLENSFRVLLLRALLMPDSSRPRRRLQARHGKPRSFIVRRRVYHVCT